MFLLQTRVQQNSVPFGVSPTFRNAMENPVVPAAAPVPNPLPRPEPPRDLLWEINQWNPCNPFNRMTMWMASRVGR